MTVRLFRQCVLLVVATGLTWWVLWHQNDDDARAQKTRREDPATVSVVPQLAPPDRPPAAPGEETQAPPKTASKVEDNAAGLESPRPVAPSSKSSPNQPEQRPLPQPEVGSPDAEESKDGSGVESASETSSLQKRLAVDALMNDAGLQKEAAAEFESSARPGFATVFLASPEDQVDIARFFGEQLVLVPRSALDPKNETPHFFRLQLEGTPAVRRVGQRPELKRYRHYRDLFDYEYAKLPSSLRELRRQVVVRTDVYLFAALISLKEWALVVARRREALQQSGRELEDVRRFVLRYHREPGHRFDIRVEEIVFADGQNVSFALETKR